MKLPKWNIHTSASWAALGGHKKIVEILIKRENTSSLPQTPFTMALFRDDQNFTKYLIGILPSGYFKLSDFMLAIYKNNLEILQLLVLRVKDNKHDFPFGKLLVFAFQYSYSQEIITYLMEISNFGHDFQLALIIHYSQKYNLGTKYQNKFANVTDDWVLGMIYYLYTNYTPDFEDYTSLTLNGTIEFLGIEKSGEILTKFILYWLDNKLRDYTLLIPFFKKIKTQIPIQWDKPVFQAAKKGNKNALIAYATMGANLNIYDEDGCTPLYYFVQRRACSSGSLYVCIVNILIN